MNLTLKVNLIEYSEMTTASPDRIIDGKLLGQIALNLPQWKSTDTILRGIDDSPKIVPVGDGKEYRIFVEWYGQTPDQPIKAPGFDYKQKHLFPVSGFHLSSLIENPDRLFVPFLGRVQTLSEDNDAHHYRESLGPWLLGNSDFGMIVTTPDRWWMENLRFSRYPSLVKPIQDSSVGIITPKPFYHPEIQTRIDTSSTIEARISQTFFPRATRCIIGKTTPLT